MNYKTSLFIVFFAFSLSLIGCKKCNLKGDILLSENFDEQGDWLLYSDVSDEVEVYTRIEEGTLKLKSDQKSINCQRATYNFENDFSEIDGFQACIHINELRLPAEVDVHLYFSLGDFELHATISKEDTENKTLKIKAKRKGIQSNLKGALVGNLGMKYEKNLYEENFIQVSLCPEEWEDSEGELYIEIDKIEITTLTD
jgi:hypothetical protein